MLQPVEGLEFDSAQHRYCYKGDWLPWSVTQIVSPKTAYQMEKINADKDGPDGWAARGSAIHGYLEKHLRGEGVVYDTRWGDWVNPLLDWWLFQGPEVLALELPLVDPKKRVAGSCDFLLKSPKTGRLILGDLKTVKTAKAAKAREAASAQLGAYSHMLLDSYGIAVEQCLTVVSGPGVVEYKLTSPDEAGCAWLDAWDAHKLLQPDW